MMKNSIDTYTKSELKTVNDGTNTAPKYIYNANNTASKISKIIKVIVIVFFIALVIILLYTPILVIALQSINGSKNSEIFSEFSFKWYVGLFNPDSLSGNDAQNARALQNAVKNTLSITFLSTIISTIFGTAFAIGINSLSNKRRHQMIMLNNVPIVNADIVTGITLMIIFSLVFKQLGFGTILLSHIFFSIPYVVLSVLPKLSEIDNNLYDAAVDLGCSPIKAIIKVVLPAIKSGILMGVLFAFTMSIDDFTISYFNGASLDSLNNVSMIVYLRKGKALSPSTYSYNTILTLGTLICLVGYNIIGSLKKKKNK